ncbi:HlyD family secretion protein [Endozoicomonas arenosclerae]|uniref:HlyD family secretion protein n=1 Tax=Endozoicomonas arenosclerae TaxID=1633495 RepID=UPI0007804723|nr:efflux RND transporter periplasmic adaptor subunit [Endozoicomonas arenosclerae]
MTTPQRYATVIVSVFLWVAGFVLVTNRYIPNTDFATLQAYTVPVSSLVAGNITRVEVTDNQKVSAGDLLFGIDPEPVNISLTQAQEAYQVAHEHFQSLNRLFQSKSVSRDDFLQAGKALYLNARSLAEARYQQKHILTHAPVTGFVTNLEVRPGQYAETGQRIMTLIDDSDWWIYTNVKENNLTRVIPGQPVLISLNTCPGLVIKGTVSTIARGVDTDETGPSGLAQVERSSNWIRLAQRFPVRVIFDRSQLPEDCRLYNGTTAITSILTVDNFLSRTVASGIQQLRTHLQYLY